MNEDKAREAWKVGDEFLPFHRQASHVNPDYRDGWNACYRAALQWATSQQAAEGWRPIESAPKDGTEVLLSNGETVAQGSWLYSKPYINERRDLDGRYIDQDEFDGYEGWIDSSGGMQPDPTHYMPLPAPPSTQGGAFLPGEYERMTENGRKSWAGVDPQDLRDGNFPQGGADEQR